MQKPYDRKKELICIIYCPNCKGAVAACKESSVNVTAEGEGDLYSPQNFNEQAVGFVERGYKTGKVSEIEAKKVADVQAGKAIQAPPITVCKCKKQNT
jgi:hypothetical protein